MKPHLFLFTIGPVQSFIAQARKTQDLFAGSRLLSTLARIAYEDFSSRLRPAQVDLLFPSFYYDDGKPVPSNPNRFAVIVPAEVPAERLAQIGKDVKQSLIATFVRESMDRMSFLSDRAMTKARLQLENHLDIHWAFMPLDQGGYTSRFRSLEAYMASIKNFRQWHQNPESGRKCSVDGQRDVIVYRKSFSESRKAFIPKLFQAHDHGMTVIETSDERDVKVWSLEPGEGLSAVSYAKRTFKQIAHTFPSTARVCLMNVIEKIKDWEEFKAMEREPKRLLEHSDDQFLFEENINAQAFKKAGVCDEESAIAAPLHELKALHHRLVSRMEHEEIREGLNTKYYAIIVFDGDEMGQWLGGHNLVDASRLQALHQRLRDLLRDFGKWAMDYLDAPRGKAVYAGGDDFLGFINLNHLFSVLKEMRTQFDIRVNKPLQAETEQFQVVRGKQFTFSAGVAIGHYKQPLGMVLEEARDAEKQAKKAGRNAFVISVIRHSGGTTRTVGTFGSELGLGQCLIRMETICRQLSGRKYSNKFMHNFIAETRVFGQLATEDMARTEILRLLDRARNKSATAEDREEMQSAVLSLAFAEGSRNPESTVDLKQLISTLRVCDFIYRITNSNEEA